MTRRQPSMAVSQLMLSPLAADFQKHETFSSPKLCWLLHLLIHHDF